MSTSVCRVCLACNTRMTRIVNSKHLGIYEKLTSSKLNAGDGMPDTICYICYSQLQRCTRVSDMAHTAQIILRELVHNGTEITHENVTMRNHSLIHNLSVTNIPMVTINDCSEHASTPVTVKEEPNENVETTAEDSEIIEPEDSTLEDVKIGESLTKNMENYLNGRNEMKNSNSSDGVLYFYCDVCKKKFASKYQLVAHLRMHTGEKPYSCHICARAFSQNQHLTKHMRIHTGEKPYPCLTCNRAFSHKLSLNTHMRIHTRKRTYPCQKCKSSFSQKHNLSRHMQIHKEEKKYSCQICKQVFYYKNCLTLHMRIHTGEKPYCCHICARAFSQNQHLTRHMLIHTGEKPYSCQRCDRAFSLRSHLTSHMRRLSRCDYKPRSKETSSAAPRLPR